MSNNIRQKRGDGGTLRDDTPIGVRNTIRMYGCMYAFLNK